jgi:TolB-like protein/Tfp pilus assembly protein PilF
VTAAIEDPSVKSLLAELKRRHVFRVSAVYLVSAWLIMQVVDVMFGALRLPEWSVTLAAALVIIGFPVALLLAWAYELTPRGPGREPDAGQAEPATRDTAAPNSSGKKRIVVLPFENLGSREDDYFASGMTEELTSRLALVAALGVISRTTAVQYDKTGKNLKRIGEDLGVQYVLEGTVRWAKDPSGNSRVRITPQLISVADDTHIWADTFDRVVDDIFQLQTEIAEAVIVNLGVALLDPERRNVESRPTTNFDAYQAYLRGLYYARPRGFLEERDRVAVEMLEQAVALDPRFSLAHAELCMTHSALYHYGFDHSQARLTMATRAANVALELAPEVPMVRLANGYYHYWCLRDYDTAYAEFTIAEKGMPGHSEALAAMGFVRRRQGKFDSALRLFEKAVDLNPMDTHFAIQVADTLCSLRRYSEAEHYYDRSIRFLPDQVAAHVAKASLSWEWKGDVEGARAALEAMPEKESNSSFGAIHWIWQEIFEGNYAAALARIAGLSDDIVVPRTKDLLCGQIHALMGEQEMSRQAFGSALKGFEEESRAEPENPYLHAVLGIVYAGLGRKNQAINEAKRATDLCTISNDVLDGAALRKILALVYATVGEHQTALNEIEYLLGNPVGNLEYLPLFPTPLSVAMLRIDPRWNPLAKLSRFSEICEKHTIRETSASNVGQ